MQPVAAPSLGLGMGSVDFPPGWDRDGQFALFFAIHTQVDGDCPLS